MGTLLNYITNITHYRLEVNRTLAKNAKKFKFPYLYITSNHRHCLPSKISACSVFNSTNSPKTQKIRTKKFWKLKNFSEKKNFFCKISEILRKFSPKFSEISSTISAEFKCLLACGQRNFPVRFG